MNRRQFLGTTISVGAVGALANFHSVGAAQSEWGGPILDIHFHLRQGLDANMVHMNGCGVTNAVLLTRG